MNTPFFDSIAPLAQLPARFFVPGHKGKPHALPILGELLRWDLTEVPGAGDLANPTGPLAESQNNMARVYGSGATLYSAFGSTSCIQAMFALFLRPGQRVAMARNCHISAVRALAFTEAAPLWMLPQAGRITPETLERTLAGSGAVAAYVTSPDYFGRLSDISALAQVCRRHGARLLVDNAHGAHLRFVAPGTAAGPPAPAVLGCPPPAEAAALPAGSKVEEGVPPRSIQAGPGTCLHPLALGADAVAESAHKTLPCLTPAALLHLRDAGLAAPARQALNLFSSTSPSYPVLLSLDLAAGLLLAETEAPGSTPARFDEAAAALGLVAARVPHLVEACDDPLKLCLLPAPGGWPAAALAKALAAAGILPEYADETRIVLMASPWNQREEFDLLQETLLAFEQKTPIDYSEMAFVLPKQEMGTRQALLAEKEHLPLPRAKGRILASLAVPCPPGMPLALPGERLDEALLQGYAESGIFELDVVK